MWTNIANKETGEKREDLSTQTAPSFLTSVLPYCINIACSSSMNLFSVYMRRSFTFPLSHSLFLSRLRADPHCTWYSGLIKLVNWSNKCYFGKFLTVIYRTKLLFDGNDTRASQVNFLFFLFSCALLCFVWGHEWDSIGLWLSVFGYHCI